MLNPVKMLGSDSTRSYVLWVAGADAYAYEIQDFNGRISYFAVVNGQIYAGKPAFVIARNIARMYFAVQAERARIAKEQRRARAGLYPSYMDGGDRLEATRKTTRQILKEQERMRREERINQIGRELALHSTRFRS
jgi:hypothetical protein